VSAFDYYLFSGAFDLVELHGCVAFWSWHGGGWCRLLDGVDM
jgi:hypothetical protein